MELELRFGLVGIAEKNIWATFKAGFFKFLWSKSNKKKLKHCSVGTKKLHIWS